MKRIVFAVTNDLNYDQRMIRICTSLQAAGYDVCLMGRKHSGSLPLVNRSFKQLRMPLFFNKGKLFYLEYNLKLFFYLLFLPCDLIGSIDLDTIVPCYYASKLKGCARLHDAHELFCEMKEIVSRPKIKTIWKWVERTYLPHYPLGYTVNEFIREEFRKLYKLDYAVIRNAAVFQENHAIQKQNESFILYQGAVNEGRSFETLIPAMKWVDLPLYICGTGNFMEKAKRLVKEHGLENKVLFKGNLLPEALKALTSDAVLGLTLFDSDASNTYQSLANRFFDYMHAGIPQVCVDYPQYRAINDELPVAILISNLSSESIAAAINELIRNKDLHSLLSNNALIASKKHCWQEEEKVLLSYYKQQFP